MRRNHIIKHTCIAWSLILGLASCGDESLQDARSLDAKSTPMTFTVSHPGKKLTPKNTRATETDFEKNQDVFERNFTKHHIDLLWQRNFSTLHATR